MGDLERNYFACAFLFLAFNVAIIRQQRPRDAEIVLGAFTADDLRPGARERSLGPSGGYNEKKYGVQIICWKSTLHGNRERFARSLRPGRVCNRC